MAGRTASYGYERPATRSSRRAHSPSISSSQSSGFSSLNSPRAKKRSVDVHDQVDETVKSQSGRHNTRNAPLKSVSTSALTTPVEMVHSHFTRRSTSPDKSMSSTRTAISPRDRISASEAVKVPIVPARKFFSKSRNEERPKPQFNVNNIFNKKQTWGKNSSQTNVATYSITTNKSSSSNSLQKGGGNSRNNSPCNVMTVQSSNVSKTKTQTTTQVQGKKTSQVVIKLSRKNVGCPRTEEEKLAFQDDVKTIEVGSKTRSGEVVKSIKIIVKKPPTPEPSPPEDVSAIDLPTPSPPSPLEEPTPESSASSTPEPLPQPHLDSEIKFKPIQIDVTSKSSSLPKVPSPVEAEPTSEPCPPPPNPVISMPPKKKFFTKSRTETGGNKPKPQFNAKSMFGFNDDGDGSGSTLAQSSASTDNKPGTSGAKSSSQGDDDEWVTLHRVKKAHQCHELGETESFDEDIQYCLNGLEKGNLIRIRCLSIEQLTNQCMGAEFRMHLRAHDDMPKIIKALSDAPKNSDLAFCTSLLMFIYNQDRLTMDIDPNHLSLMLDLLEVREEDGIVDKKHTIKAKSLVEQMKSRGYGKFLDPSNLSAGKLALEALLGLTSKRAGDWFKDELRNLKGLDFLMNTIIRIVNSPANSRAMAGLGVCLESELNKIDRALRVLEASTYMHEVNQLYVINYEDGSLINTCTTLLKSCKDSIVLHHENKMYLTTLLSILRVFTNITSESIKGSKLMGTNFENLFYLFLDTLFEIPSFVCPDSRFDLMVLLLCLCINLVEFCPSFRKELLSDSRKLRTLVDILMKRIEEAKETEAQADEILESAEKDQKTNDIVNIDTLLNQVVAKSGKHMEHSIIAACVSLLLGCSIQSDPKAGKELIAKWLPDGSFEPLIDVLRKLHEFAHLADIMTPSGVKRVERILKVFKSSDPIVTANDSIIDLDDPADQQRHQMRPSSPSLMSINDTFLNETIDDTSFDQSKSENEF